MTTKEQFIHRFRCGMAATLTLTVDLQSGSFTEFRVEWSRKLKPKRARRLLAEYQTWRNTCVQRALERHGITKPALIVDTGSAPTVNVITTAAGGACAKHDPFSPHGPN